jgi:hypothetical protein
MPPFPAAQKLLYIVPNLEECHGPDDVGQAGGDLGEIAVAAGDRRGIRAREEQSQPVRRERAGVGETRHETYGPGQFKVHDLENLGDKEMVFMTIEFLQSANKPMSLPEGVRQQAAA